MALPQQDEQVIFIEKTLISRVASICRCLEMCRAQLLALLLDNGGVRWKVVVVARHASVFLRVLFPLEESCFNGQNGCARE